jgi:hypothetical protein
MNGVVVNGSSQIKNQAPIRLLLVNDDGTAVPKLKQAPAQADSVATTIAGLVTDFNALLAKLRTAGILAP